MATQAAVQREAQADDRLTRVLALANGLLAKKGRPPVADDQDLRQAGLSSLDSVNLMLAVEGEFDLFIPQAEMTPENFGDCASIADLIARLG